MRRVMLASLVLAVTGISAGSGRPAPLADPPKPIVELFAKPIGIPPARFTGNDSPQSPSTPVPTPLPEGRKYIVFWDTPLLVDWDSSNGGDIEVTPYDGPRAFATDKIVCSQGADADNPDITSVKAAKIYEIKYKSAGAVMLRVMPALKLDKDGKPAPLTRDDITRRVLALGNSVEPPVDPVDADPEVRSLTLQLRSAFKTEAANDKAVSVRELASLSRSVAKSLAANDYIGDDSTKNLKTQADFNAQWQSAREKLIDGKIPVVRKKVGEYLDAKWDRNPSGVFGQQAKKIAADSLNQVAKSLDYLRAN